MRNTSRFVLRSHSVLDSTYDSFVSAASGVISIPGIIPACARICGSMGRKLSTQKKTYTSTALVGFEVLTTVSTKMAVFWVVAPCSLVEVYRRFRGPCCLHHQGNE
jgi:hypothetical protein